jgi:hypothetical protein
MDTFIVREELEKRLRDEEEVDIKKLSGVYLFCVNAVFDSMWTWDFFAEMEKLQKKAMAAFVFKSVR